MFKQLLTMAAVFAVFASASIAQAEIVFGVTSNVPDPISVGSMGTLTFSVSADTAAEQAMFFDAYQVGFNVSGFGGASDTDFVLSAPGPGVYGPPAFAPLGGGDYGAGGAINVAFPTSVDLSVSRNLFTVDFAVIGGTAGAGFNIDVRTVTNGVQTVDPNITFANADLGASFAASPELRLSFTAVPEPSSFLMMGIAGLFALKRRRS